MTEIVINLMTLKNFHQANKIIWSHLEKRIQHSCKHLL